MLVVHSINELVTVHGPNSLRQGKDMNQVEIIKNGYFVVENGRFIEIGSGLGYQKFQDAEFVDATNQLVTPGFIDSHTHLVHAGSREHELEMKLNGVSYLDILKQGGGILNTVAKTRRASFSELYDQACQSLERMLQFGVTALEAKSGYGLALEPEMKQLEVSRQLAKDYRMTIVNTFLGAHALPNEFKDRRKDYLQELKKMLNEIKAKELAEFCDCFCEEGVFSIAESEEILSYAKGLGFRLKIHADEMIPLGGASLASKLNATSADHLLASTLTDFQALAKAQVVANVLPLTSLFLDKPMAKVRDMIASNCGLAIATDYNPGSSPSENIQLAMQVASLKGKMTPKEVITAVTMNAAISLGLEQTKGSISIGKDADFVIFDCPNLDYLIYHFGINHVKDVYLKGEIVVKDQKILRKNVG